MSTSQMLAGPVKADALRRERIRFVLNLVDFKGHQGLDLLFILNDAPWNPSAGKPYHGFQHLLTVAGRAFDGGLAYELPKQSCRNLLLAGLFHDVGHRQVDDDWANIETAVAALHRAHTEHRLGPADDQDVKAITRLIGSTCFPYTEAAHNLEEAILRDADLMQTLEPDAPRWLAALATETGRPVTTESTREFFLRTGVHTEWGRYQFRVAGHQVPFDPRITHR